MSRERFVSRAGQTDGARPDDERFGGCITDGALQAMADGSLRGPELFLARQHVDECPRCSAELTAYAALNLRLGQLVEPQLPPGFTAAVLAAVELREQTRDERHRAVLSGLPAALIAFGLLLLWAFGGDTGARVRDLVVGATVFQHVAEATLSVLAAARLPIGVAALLSTVALLAALARQVTSVRATIARSCS